MWRIVRTWTDVIDEAWHELRRARLRTYLATAGIVLGAVGLTVLMCMFHLESRLRDEEADNSIEIGMPGLSDEHPIFTRMRRLRRYHFIPADAAAIQMGCPDVERVNISGAAAGVDFKGKQWHRGLLASTNIRHTDPAPNGPGKWVMDGLGTLQWGRTFTPAEMTTGARVVLIDEKMSRKLWSPVYRTRDSSYLGSRYIHINGVKFEVIGLLVGQLGDGRAIIPYTCMERSSWTAYWSLSATAKAGRKRAAAKEIDAVLGRRIGDPGSGYSYVLLPGMRAEEIRAYTFFGIVGILVLLAAGMALSNKAYIDALERAQQFAVRRALGATTQRIYAIVLTESALICGFGCLYGGVIGWMIFVTFAAWQLGDVENQLWTTLPALRLAAVFLFVIALGVLGSLQGAAAAAKADPAEVLSRKDVV